MTPLTPLLQLTRIRAKLLASAIAVVLTPTIALATYAVPAQAQAADEVQAASCQVHAVLASKEGNVGIPKELAFMKAQLEGDDFAAYKSFHLVGKKAFEITRGKASEVTFRSGNKLGLSLLGNDDKRLKLQVNLTGRDGSKNLLKTNYSIEDTGLLIVGGVSYEYEKIPGKLFFAIQCAGHRS